MSKHTCKIFAEELLSAYKTGLEALKAAVSEAAQLRAYKPDSTSAGAFKRHEEALLNSIGAVKKAARWTDFYNAKADISARFDKYMREVTTFKPADVDISAVDISAVEILKSGLMTPNDFAAMFNGFADNYTMARMTMKYMDELRTTLNDPHNRGVDPAERQAINNLYANARAALDKPRTDFESICEALDRLTGLSSGTVGNSSHVDAMFNMAEKMLPSIEAAISAL